MGCEPTLERPNPRHHCSEPHAKLKTIDATQQRHTRELHGTNGELLRRRPHDLPLHYEGRTAWMKTIECRERARKPHQSKARSRLIIDKCGRELGQTTAEPPMGLDPTTKMPFGTSLATFVAAPPSNGPDAPPNSPSECPPTGRQPRGRCQRPLCVGSVQLPSAKLGIDQPSLATRVCPPTRNAIDSLDRTTLKATCTVEVPRVPRETRI